MENIRIYGKYIKRMDVDGGKFNGIKFSFGSSGEESKGLFWMASIEGIEEGAKLILLL